MDEFVHYHALGCASAPRSRDLPEIRDGCGYFDLRLPLTTEPLPLRSYSYIGSFPVAPFYPLWKLLADPLATRVQGAFFFLLWAALAAPLLRVRPSAIVTGALVFPVWLVTFVVDEGPVGLSAVLLLLALSAARRALDATGRGSAAAWAAGAGLALFLGIWTKLVFAWWFPAFLVFAIVEARRHSLSLGITDHDHDRLRAKACGDEFVTVSAEDSNSPPYLRSRSWRQFLEGRHVAMLVAGAVALLLPTAVLLASTDRDGQLYGAVLWHGNFSAAPEDVETVAVRLLRYVVDGSLVTPRNLTLPSWPVDLLPLLLCVVLLAAGWRWSARRRDIVTWFILSALTYAFVAGSGYSQWPHHFAFPLHLLVFALALCVDGLPRLARVAATAVAVLFWATLGARLPTAAFPADSSPDKDRLLAFVSERQLDRSTLQVHASWGTYYAAQLFGDPERMVVYVRRIVDDTERLRQMERLARRVGRPILLVSSRRFERIDTPQVRSVLGQPRHAWQFGTWWAIEYPPAGLSSP